jgi:ABC-type branched-subunit amino acid transport system ATPase component
VRDIDTSKDALAANEVSDILLEAQGLRVGYQNHQVLDGVDLRLRRGDVVLINGDNGAGKTTLLNVLTGYFEPQAGVIRYYDRSGCCEFKFPQTPWRRYWPGARFSAEKLLSMGVVRVWQDRRLFTHMTVLENGLVAIPDQEGERPLANLMRPRLVAHQSRSNRAWVQSWLDRTGLSPVSSNKASQLSLGQAKRCALVRALSQRGKILFLDEPLTGLDHSGCLEVTQLLADLTAENQLTLVIVEHSNLSDHLKNLVNTVWHLEGGFLSQQALTAIKPEPVGESAIISKLKIAMASNGFQYCEQTLHQGAKLTIYSRRRDIYSQQSKPVIEFKNLHVNRDNRYCCGDGTDCNGFSLQLHDGETAILEAPNGWGKTSLMETMAGLLPAASGQILLKGVPIQSLPVWSRAEAGLGLLTISQSAFPGLTVKQILRLDRVSCPAGWPLNRLDRPIAALSGGERQWLALHCFLDRKSWLVRLLDEPFTGLDQTSMQRLLESAWLREGVNLIAIPGGG